MAQKKNAKTHPKKATVTEEAVPQTKEEEEPVVTETEGKPLASDSKNGRRSERGGGAGDASGGAGTKASVFTWVVVLALLGVWTSVAVVYFEIVDYDSVIARAKEFRMNFSEVLQGRLTAYDTDGDGDFDVEDAKVLLGLSKDADGADVNANPESLEEVLNILADEGSDWMYGFFTFLYDVVSSPAESDEKKLKGSTLTRDGMKKEDKRESKKKGKSKEEKTLQAIDEEIQLPKGLKERPHLEAAPEEQKVLKTDDITKPLSEPTNQTEAEPEGEEPTEETPPVSESLDPSPVSEDESVSDDLVSRSDDVELEIQAAVPLFSLVEGEFVPDDPPDSIHPDEDEVPAIDKTGVLVEESLSEESEVDSDKFLTSSKFTQESDSDQYLTSSKFTQESEPSEQVEEPETQSEPVEPSVEHSIEPSIEPSIEHSIEPEPHSDTHTESESDSEAQGTTEKLSEEKLKEKAKKKKPKLLNKYDKTIKAEIDAAEKLRKKGKLEEALRAFESLVQLHPQSPRARYGRAQVEDSLAEKQRSNEMLQKAINSYREAAELPDVSSDLLRASLKRRAERQQFLGRMRGSLATLDKLTQIFPEDIELKNELGVAHLLLGDNKAAKRVYQEVLAIAPGDGFAKVHYGFILKSENKIAESIPYLKEGLESGAPGTDDGRFYFHLGDALQRIGDDSAYDWYELGHQRGHFASVWQRSLYNVDGLKAQPWWTAKETGYTDLVKTLERNWKTIRDEALAVMDQDTASFIPEEENLREKGEWGQHTLWQQGKKAGNACQGVPKTCALLERYTEATGCKRGQIKFSVMQPGTHVWPHTGPTNCRLRLHLGLVIPKQGCKIRCTDKSRTWEEGKVLIFDDSFEHEVWQDAESFRLIFIVDVWHPELTTYQRQTLSAI